jgi:hypothetical protein
MKDENLGEITWGYGMWFLHESIHTWSGSKYYNSNAAFTFADPPASRALSTPGVVEAKVNKFREEMDKPQRQQYGWDGAEANATMNWSFRGATTAIKSSVKMAEETSEEIREDAMTKFLHSINKKK